MGWFGLDLAVITWNDENPKLSPFKTLRENVLFQALVWPLLGLVFLILRDGFVEGCFLIPISIGVVCLILVPVMDNAHAKHLAKTRAREKLMSRASADSVFRYYWFEKMCEEKGHFDVDLTEFDKLMGSGDYYRRQEIHREVQNPGSKLFLNEYILWEKLEQSVRNEAEYEYEKWRTRLDREVKQILARKKRQQEEEKSNRSRRIQQRVKDEVWRRDEGKCVKCGSRERLEYDHIIPFSKGGSNTARNIELLCEGCNRRKGSKI